MKLGSESSEALHGIWIFRVGILALLRRQEDATTHYLHVETQKVCGMHAQTGDFEDEKNAAPFAR